MEPTHQFKKVIEMKANLIRTELSHNLVFYVFLKFFKILDRNNKKVKSKCRKSPPCDSIISCRKTS